MKRLIILPHLLLVLSLAGCAQLTLPGGTQIPQPTREPPTTPEVSESPVAEPDGPLRLQIWLPREFSPLAEDQASELLQARMEEFSDLHPDVRVEVRPKIVEGPGGMLDMLAAASEAAPLALPDLVLLPRAGLETITARGLAYPLDDTLEDEDWFPFAFQLGQVNGKTFGLPFAGDALIMAYRPEVVKEPPATWAAALESAGPMAFPAADPQALITAALYQSAGGKLADEDNQPNIELAAIQQVLDFYQRGQAGELMPFWIAQYERDELAWEAFADGRADMVITWASRYFDDPPEGSAAAPLPTPDGNPYTLASGWVWVLTGPETDRHEISIELAAFLSESEFLAQWTQAAGYLPPRPSALTLWHDGPQQTLIGQIGPSAQLTPPASILASVGPALSQATISVLKNEADAPTAAETAVQSLGEN